ncbi:Flagellar operon protein [Candidatus Zixiibacteriota bacterium]|nr:Flagellar operon protein [candidate division Zixibacteria bacterium]
MRINSFNSQVKLLDIVQGDKAKTVVNKINSNLGKKENFAQELAKAREINFSKHARERLFSRGIELSDSKLNQLSQAIDKASVKGSKETLILDESSAYVVSVPNRTVITAFGKENLREGVFTSIDSAIIL